MENQVTLKLEDYLALKDIKDNFDKKIADNKAYFDKSLDNIINHKLVKVIAVDEYTPLCSSFEGSDRDTFVWYDDLVDSIKRQCEFKLKVGRKLEPLCMKEAEKEIAHQKELVRNYKNAWWLAIIAFVVLLAQYILK